MGLILEIEHDSLDESDNGGHRGTRVSDQLRDTYGPPVCILSHNEKQFDEKFFEEIFRLLGSETCSPQRATRKRMERLNDSTEPFSKDSAIT